MKTQQLKELTDQQLQERYAFVCKCENKTIKECGINSGATKGWTDEKLEIETIAFERFKGDFDAAQSDTDDIEDATNACIDKYLAGYPVLKDRIDEHQITNAMQYGFTREQAENMILNGIIDED